MDFEKLYIGGQWTAGASGRFIEVENPATRQIFARVPAGNEEDVDKAARAAHEALPAWAALPLTERIDLMEKFLAISKARKMTSLTSPSKSWALPTALPNHPRWNTSTCAPVPT